MLHTGLEITWGIMIPFLGTSLGAAWVFFMKETFKPMLQKILAGFAAGVMAAASVWSLLIPALEQSASMGRLAFIPATVGFSLGILFLLLLDCIAGCLHPCDEIKADGGREEKRGRRTKDAGSENTGKRKKNGSRKSYRTALTHTGMMILAVTLHNIPEGMAVGVVFAGRLSGSSVITSAEALALSVGIAIQNIPEGAIISMPLRAGGADRRKAFLYGVLSGIVEPAAAALTVLASSFVLLVLPYLLGFAAGAMVYVVVEELIPEMSDGARSHRGMLFFAAGFILMLALDTALG